MPSPLIRKLEQFTRLSRDERQMLEQASFEAVRQMGPREDVIREREPPQALNLILSGWACRYKYLEDGRRQIISFLIPGDLCDNPAFVLREMDHSIGTLTPATVAQIARPRIEWAMAQYPRLAQALWWESLVCAAVQREWTVSLGQRDATERLSHLLCEIFLRLRGVGLVEGDACELPVKQAELADALGLSTVHVNRTLQELRAAGLIGLKGKILTVPSLPALMATAGFSPHYLHMDREGRHLDAAE